MNQLLSSLTEEQKKAVLAEAEALLKQQAEQKKQDISAYKALVNESVEGLAKTLTTLSETMAKEKTNAFRTLEACIKLKQELYGITAGQMSHTFTNTEGTVSITIGFRSIDSYDDTANEGIAMVRDALESLAVTPETSRLVKVVNSLLKKDKQGNLKANRVVELVKLAEEFPDTRFQEGVSIITQAHKPLESSYFLEIRTRDAHGVWKNIPLNMGSVAFTDAFLPVSFTYNQDADESN